MAKNLVIVESPAKAKTIEGFLGKDFLVKSSYGHVRDLPSKGLSIDIENGFAPDYEVMPDKKAVISELKKLAKGAEQVWLATDEDREGEAISWHLAEALGLDIKTTRRIVFHEITKNAILKAIDSPRFIDQNLVNAQQARRVLDRLVGFELSPVLWRKVKPSLSAGRVQSVAVRLIVEREREINEFQSASAFRVVALFRLNGSAFKAELPKRFSTEEEARQFLEKCKGAQFTVRNVETKPAKKSPSAPFTTSTLQQEASRKLGFSVSQTMVVAQRLYESGKITYMRTDSVNLSDTAIDSAVEQISRLYGKEFAERRRFKTKSKSAQEAHEAIRPTYLNNPSVDGDSNEKRLYDLIWKRTIASQMADARLERTTANIEADDTGLMFQAQGEVLKFEGFLKVYMEGSDDEESEEQSGMLPPIKQGDKPEAEEIVATERFTHHPPRYTEASLVKKLEELGIGRPSTYAPTISTIQKRGYVVKEDRPGVERKYRVLTLKSDNLNAEDRKENTGAEKSKLFPTDIGSVVTDFLVTNFSEVLDYTFTATVEKEFDEIAEGQRKWNSMIEDFYKQFHQRVEETLETSEKATGERALGTDPKSGKPIIARIGRFGPMVQIGTVEDEEKPKFASLRAGQRIDQITLEEALDLFKLPRVLGEYEGKDVSANVGRFGPYVRHGSLFASLGKEDDVMEVTIDRAIELIEAKKKSDREKILRTYSEDPEMKVLKGRWGPYLAVGKKNFRLPKGTDPEEISYEKAMEIVGSEKSSTKAAAAKKPTARKTAAKKKTTKKKATAKKTAAKKTK